MKTSKVLKWTSFGLEFILGIPFIGAMIIMGFFYLPVILMLALHITTLVICNKQGANKAGSIVGIIASVIGWMPFIGWMIHFGAAIVLLVEAILLMIKPSEKEVSTQA
jgi:hypothetical protein